MINSKGPWLQPPPAAHTRAGDEDLSMIEQLPPPAGEIEFEPLDDTVAADLEVLESIELKQLSARWKEGIPGANGDIGPEDVRLWREASSVEMVSQHVAAVAAMMRNTILMAFSVPAEAYGLIHFGDKPRFGVFPEADSLLAREKKLRAGQPFTYFTADFAIQISTRCAVSTEFGELSWRALTACLREHACDALLPGLQVQTKARESVVRLRSPKT